VQLGFTVAPLALPQIRADRVRALGVSSATRWAAAPELPTIAESGLPGFEAYGWYGIAAPAGTPAPVIARLHEEIARAPQAGDVRERLAAAGLDAVGGTPQEFAGFIQAELAKWAKLVRDAKIKVDVQGSR